MLYRTNTHPSAQNPPEAKVPVGWGVSQVVFHPYTLVCKLVPEPGGSVVQCVSGEGGAGWDSVLRDGVEMGSQGLGQTRAAHRASLHLFFA